jgi:hypothetical protein
MAYYFFDTSALVKRYHLEAGSSNVAKVLADPNSSDLISRWVLWKQSPPSPSKFVMDRFLLLTLPPVASGSRQMCAANPQRRSSPRAPIQRSGPATTKARPGCEAQNARLSSTRHRLGPENTRSVESPCLCRRESLQTRGRRRALSNQS